MYIIAGFVLIHVTWSSAHQAGCDERGPVCGNDGKTYETMCQLIWARLEDIDLQVLHEGTCTGKYPYGSLNPSQGEVLYLSGFEGKFKKQKYTGANHAKLKLMMPYGWPPLGPIAPIRQLLKADEERNKRFHEKV